MTDVELYLVRHAIAAARGPSWPEDEARPLTDRGISRFTRAVAGLALLELGIDLVLTSPLVRARQTADVLAAGLAERPPVRVVEALSPGHAPGHVLAELARVRRGRRVALVGHEPDLGELAAWLVGATRAVPMKKGSVCRIDVRSLSAEPAGTLVWLATPRMLRQLAQ
jgi:phosphohistidine phosphatase